MAPARKLVPLNPLKLLEFLEHPVSKLLLRATLCPCVLMPANGVPIQVEFSAIVVQAQTTQSLLLVMTLKVIGLSRILGEPDGESQAILDLLLVILATCCPLHTRLFEYHSHIKHPRNTNISYNYSINIFLTLSGGLNQL